MIRSIVFRKRNVALFTLGVGIWAADVTVNDEWPEWQQLIPRWNKTDINERPHIVVLGSGWGSSSFLRKLDSHSYRVTIVSPRNHFLFTPLLAGSTVGTVEPRSIVEPIRGLLARSNCPEATYLQGEATSVDVQNNTVMCQDTSQVHGDVDTFKLKYDHLIIGIGAKPATFNIPGVEEHALFMKEIDDSKKIRDRINDCLETASLPGQSKETISRLLSFVIVGGGPSGVEFAAELHDFLKDDVSRLFPKLCQDDVKVSVYDALPHILPMFDQKLIEYTEDHFSREGIKVCTDTRVTKVEKDHISIMSRDQPNASKVPYGALVWVTGLSARSLTRSLMNQLEHSPGRGPQGLMTDMHLNVHGTNNIWALGDCALTPARLPPTAQVASQQGSYLGRMFNHLSRQGYQSSNHPQQSYRPFVYKHKGSFAYIGDLKALAQIPKTFHVNTTSSSSSSSSTEAADNEENLSSRAITDPVPPVHDDLYTGRTTFLAWRTVYFSKLLSSRNR